MNREFPKASAVHFVKVIGVYPVDTFAVGGYSMTNKRCKLYDENLVHNIMLSTGLSIVEYFRGNANADSDEICDFVEANAEVIISDTIRHLKNMNEFHEKTGEDPFRDTLNPGEDDE